MVAAVCVRASYGIATVCVVSAMCACSIGGESDSNVFTVYRNSVTDENMRIHVATFDANEKDEYNRANCKQAKRFFKGSRVFASSIGAKRGASTNEFRCGLTTSSTQPPARCIQ
jgi:hypothetical protein